MYYSVLKFIYLNFKKTSHFIIFKLSLSLINTILQMNKGTVKFFNESKGFGFIVDDESNTEYFVHVSGLIDEVREGDAVEYELKEGRKGLNAIDVKVL